MSFSVPTLSELINRADSDISASLPTVDPQLRRTVLGIIARQLASLTKGLYDYQTFISRQFFLDTAESDYLYLHGQPLGIVRLQATKSTGSAVSTGVNGTVIPAGAEMQRSDGVVFKTIGSASISSGTATLSLTSALAGSNANTIGGIQLQLTSPPVGASNIVTISVAGLNGGSDLESDFNYRARILRRKQQPPHGGTAEDYITWAKEVPGVTRAWVYPLEAGAGSVTLRFMMDDKYANGIPLAGDVTAVQNYISPRRPVTADFFAIAPVANPINFTIQLTGSDNAQIRLAVEAELRDLIRRDASPGATIYLSRINEAISIASGEFDHILTVPSGNVTNTSSQIATFGAITWV